MRRSCGVQPPAASATPGPLALLEAARRIAEQADLSGAVQAVLETANQVLGCERVCFMHADLEHNVLRLEDCHCLQAHDREESTVALDRSTVLGRVALSNGPVALRRLAAACARDETPDGLPTCIAVLRIDGALLGLFLADNPGSRRELPPDLPALLESLAHFAELAVARGDLGRLRAQFVAAVSHELRTPLTSVIAFCEMLSDGDAGPLNPEQATYLRRITAGSEQLLRIVEDLLALSRLNADAAEVHPDTVAIGPFLEDLRLTLAPQAEAAGIHVAVHVAPNCPSLRTDERRLRQALANFVDNALKFSPRGAVVTLGASFDGDSLSLWVQDRGHGIAPDQLPHIFEAFYRCPNGVNETASRGAGLGLAIVARIADVLGAKVSAASKPGQGSKFCLAFPLNSPETP
jgi:signal transduction histidine kinase